MSQDKSFDDACQQHLNWMQSLINGAAPAKKAPTAPSTNYEKQIDDLLASIEAPKEGVKQPKVSDVCAQYSSLLGDAYGPENPSPLTTTAADAVQYRISDVNEEDEDSDCEDYYVEDAEEIRGQAIPDWARAAQLRIELERQQHVDPDKIFVNFDDTCDLSAMFEKKKKTFKVRGDSGWWAADSLTSAEEAKYKKAVGLS